MTKASDNLYPKVLLDFNSSDPSAPANASWKLYAKAGGIYARSSNGVVGPFSTGSGGGVAADTIWDAKGDLAAGTGADAAQKLTVGANDTVLVADSSQTTGLKWASSWTAYTPALTGSGSNPTLGSGSTAVGRYFQLGKHVVAQGNIQFGTSGTAAGSGTYLISLPVTLRTSANAENYSIGTGYLVDNSSGAVRVVFFRQHTTTTASMIIIDGSGIVDASTPWGWAASDYLLWNFSYEAA